MHVMYANISPMLWSQLACHDGPFGGIMHVTCLFRTATKQRRCALSDTLSARVLLAVPNFRMDTTESHLAKLHSSDKSVRIATLISLARQGKDAASLVPDLISYGGQVTDRQELGVLAETFGAIGDTRAVPFLIATLESNLDARVGQRAADSLGQIGDATALPSLLAARHGPNRLVRSAARTAAAMIANGQSDPA